jgi:hypothetical protein
VSTRARLLFMKLNKVNLCDWDYLIVDCGYVDRLYKHRDNIIDKTTREGENEDGRIIKEHALMFYIDRYYVGETPMYKVRNCQADPDDIERALVGLLGRGKLLLQGAVCFKNMDLDMDFVEMLVEYQHCGGFGTEPCEVASFTTVGGKKVLYKQFDTESG